jgi:hypothetical protein
VTVIAALYLGLMLVNVVLPSGLTSPRAYFNLDWITLAVMFVIAVVGGAYFVVGRPDRGVARHRMESEPGIPGEAAVAQTADPA